VQSPFISGKKEVKIVSMTLVETVVLEISVVVTLTAGNVVVEVNMTVEPEMVLVTVVILVVVTLGRVVVLVTVSLLVIVVWQSRQGGILHTRLEKLELRLLRLGIVGNVGLDGDEAPKADHPIKVTKSSSPNIIFTEKS
jgi:hypothetical protein